MKDRWIQKEGRRLLAACMAAVCFFLAAAVSFSGKKMTSHAATFRGTNIWRGSSEVVLGKSRNYLYRWTDGYQMTFCLAPGKHMGNTVVAGAMRTTVEDDNIPYIKSREDYERLASICTWFDGEGSTHADNATYAATQAAVWAIMNGGWGTAEGLATILNRHVPGTLNRFRDLQAYVNDERGGMEELPSWIYPSDHDAAEHPVQMSLTDGVWTTELDISGAPFLATSSWQFEGDAAGWSRQVRDGKLVFTYSGEQQDDMLASAVLPAQYQMMVKNTSTMNIYIPQSAQSRTQGMISAGVHVPKVYLQLSMADGLAQVGSVPGQGTPGQTEPGEEMPELVIYRHRETFLAHYRVGLDKLCAETEQPLEGAGFRILEAFDGSQTDREDGNVRSSCMTPKPARWENFKVCAEAVTDENGRITHEDVKQYEYDKTYCDGHPEPEYLPEPDYEMDETTGQDNSDEIAAVAEENQRRKALWEAQKEACREQTDFHDEESGKALEMMLEDREKTYEEFIGLTYDYTFQEIQARYGYMRHGQHSEDEPIPVIRVSSAEAGNGYELLADREVIVDESIDSGEFFFGDEGDEEEDDGSADESSGASIAADETLGVGAAADEPAGVSTAADKTLDAGTAAAKPEVFRKAAARTVPENALDSVRVITDAPEDRAEEATASSAKRTPGAGRIPAAERSKVTTRASAGRRTAERSRVTTQASAGRKATEADAWPADEEAYSYLYSYRLLNRAISGWMTADLEDADEGVSLPAPREDEIQPLEPAEDSGEEAYAPIVKDHRTEGELHINKRDRELLDGESGDYDSYGDTQGDATLEGAVYGLYAADDIIHPDGKTGVVYKKGELTAVGSTDKFGDASFLAYTEKSSALDIVGHPLIPGRYLVKEIGRSEGYERTIPSGPEGEDPDPVGTAAVTSAMTHPIDMHDGSWLEFDVTAQGTAEGYDIVVSGFPEGSVFYRSEMKETGETVKGGVIVGTRMVKTDEFEKAEAGEYRLDSSGNYIPKTDEDGNPLYDRSKPVSRIYYLSRRLNYYPKGTAAPTDPEKWQDGGPADPDYVKQEANAMLGQMGYRILNEETGEGAQWTVLPLKGTTSRELAEEILDWFALHSFWDSGAVHQIIQKDGNYQAVIFHDYTSLPADAVYEERTGLLYVRTPVSLEGGGEAHMYVAYEPSEFIRNGRLVTVAGARQPSSAVSFPEDLEATLEPVFEPLYEQYQEGDLRLDGQGNPIPVYKKEYIYEEKEEFTSDYQLTPLEAEYDPRDGSYRIHVDNWIDWNRTEGPVTETFRAEAPRKTAEIHGEERFYSDFLTDVTGVGASAFPSVSRKEGLAELVYPGQISVMQDGEGTPGQGSRTNPFPVEEQIIRQKIKVIKDIQDGRLGKLEHFRFKLYLKSNLQRLYRNEDGEIIWLDRRGAQIDVREMKKTYPGLVPDLFTRVPRSEIPIDRDARKSVLANQSLYEKGEDQAKSGYTAVLEWDEAAGAYNYEKFFQAIRVANHDLWDDGAPTYTSYRPLGNGPNRSPAAEENAKASDMVRQFAIDWYLDEEAEKLKEEAAYGDQLYDEALCRAIRKANNYLKPFLAYDLDEIYAIRWEQDEAGGADRDRTTLPADQEAESYYWGLSRSLPYGTYVAVEQQPVEGQIQDYPNRNYAVDEPREIIVPSVYEGTEEDGEVLSSQYIYRKEMTPEEMVNRYGIRFCEESRVVSAHNDSGDFQIYPYGMSISRIRNGKDPADKRDYFILTQDRWKPYLNYYNDLDDRTAGKVTYYLAQGAGGREKIGQIYRYSSVSEAGENGSASMTGMTVAYDGMYSQALVERSPAGSGENSGKGSGEIGGNGGPTGSEDSGEGNREGDGEDDGGRLEDDQASARVRFRNHRYKSRLRIEKMDAETGENLLHDGAIFNIYRASLDTSSDGTGQVQFYEEDTVVSGSREFLTAMRARDIRPAARGLLGQGRYAGVVAAGTPVCQEKDQVFQTDGSGVRTGNFLSFTTTRDGQMKDELTDSVIVDGQQNTGYLETPQPLESGVYVIAEIKAPAGYTRCRPVAVEVYSDAVTYYLKGNRDDRVVATVYETEPEADEADPGKSEPDGIRMNDVSRIYVENQPTRLRVEKLKESADGTGEKGRKTVTYRISGRIDGSLVEIGGNPDYEYAYQNGRYMGYGWRKGTLEYLQARKAAEEQVDIVYHGDLFAGYGYVTCALDTADDDNSYVTGALMTLTEGLRLTPSGDSQDQAFEGLRVQRDANGSVICMYVEQGFAGSRTELIQTQKNGEDCWSAETVERQDTDILHYDLGDLQLFETKTIDGRQIQYGFGRNHERIPIGQLEEDKGLTEETAGGHSIFAFRGAVAVLELEGGDFATVSYSASDHVLEGEFAHPVRQADGRILMSQGVTVYHLDEEGNRDSMVDPYTGMAYAVAEDPDGGIQVLAWPVETVRDENGRITAMDKIATFRIATVEGDQPGNEYLTGSWKTEKEEQSHPLSSVKKNQAGQNMEGERLLTENTGEFEKSMDPVYDAHGLPVYYQRSGETYEEGTDLYDRSGSMTRRKEADLWENYDEASYSVDGGTPVYHRLGESYILENTWVTGESSPDDPFAGEMTAGQADILKRVPAGDYIMEELKAPEGYLKGLPVGVLVKETAQVQTARMRDRTIKIIVNKIDGPRQQTSQVLDMRQNDRLGNPLRLGTSVEGKGTSSGTQLPGAALALYEAERVYTSDLDRYPSGFYLRKKTGTPFAYWSTNSRAGTPEEQTAQWVTGETPLYLEGIPEGEYILEETAHPPGLVSASPMEITVENTGQVQAYTLYNDHTKVEIEKYAEDGTGRDLGTETLVNGAEFTLYEALTDEDGQVIYDEEGNPAYDRSRVTDRFVSSDGRKYAGFIESFEEMYRTYGTEGKMVAWAYEGQVYRASVVSHTQIDASVAGGSSAKFPTTAQMLFRTEEGTDIRVTVYEQKENRQGKDFVYEYQFDYRKLPAVNERAASYLTPEGRRRFDYLPAGASYVLVETRVPAGFAGSGPVLIRVEDREEVQRYRVPNTEGMLLISKTVSGGEGQDGKELPGARLALYRAGEDGELIQDDSHLAAWWISGTDGVYTELDRINGKIPEGYQEGDRKPHPLRRLPEGDYWLVELESPGYYRRFQPVKITYRQESRIRVCRVSDDLAEGRVEVRKTDTDGNPLTGTVFQVEAYRMPDRTAPVLVRTFASQDGTAVLDGLPVGEIQEDGSVIPYSYRLREIVPPDGYALNSNVISFEFEPDREGTSYSWDESALRQIRMEDEKTRVVLEKKALLALTEEGSEKTLRKTLEGAFLDGAVLAVYRAQGMDEKGEFLYDSEQPAAQWTTSGDQQEYVLEGLTAGQTYLFCEQKAPEGYLLMKPILFTLSEDGTRIASFSDRLSAVTVYHSGWFTLRGRSAARTEMEITGEDGQVADAWVASGYGHDFSDGQKGGTYTITEWTVYSDGSREMTASETRRIPRDSGEYLVGDRIAETVTLRLEDMDGTVIAAWNPTPETPELTVGSRDTQEEILKRNGRYVLKEITAYSDGSAREEDRFSFALDENGFLSAIIAYDQKRVLRISKRDITGGEELPGAKLQILDEQGEVVEGWVSGENPHEVEAELLPGRPYTLRESASPDGWAYESDITFRVEEDGSVSQVVMEDRKTHVSVSKTDITGEKELPGAKLRILDQNGVCLEEWISGQEPHEIVGRLTAGQTYTLREEYAPYGYSRGQDITFTVSRDGTVDRVVMKNERTPGSPGHEPEKPKPEKPAPEKPQTAEPGQPGIAMADYHPYLFDEDGVPLGGLRYGLVPETGDDSVGYPALIAVMAVSLLGMAVLWLKRKKTGLFLALFLVLAATSSEARAETAGLSEDGQLVVTFDAIDGRPGESDIPADHYLWQGQEYQLESYQQIAVSQEAREETVSRAVRYEAVEQAMEIPETADMQPAGIQAESGQSIGAQAESGQPAGAQTGMGQPDGEQTEPDRPLSVSRVEYGNWRWIPGFQFQVTVKGYDAGSFRLGDRVVEVKEEQPFAGCEKELLELIGVDPEFYLVESSEWTSEPWVGEDGLTYRQASVTGQKYVADVDVVYTGRSMTVPEPAVAYQAIYRLPEATPQEAWRTRPEAVEASEEISVPVVEIKEMPQEASGGILEWIRNLRLRTKVVLGLGILIFPILCILAVRKIKK